MAEVSIIIPVYQVERYIAACLDSVIRAELFEQSEIILIDDGSTDRSAEIAQRYAEQYGNIKLYRYENGGLSAARNRGIRRACAKYIFFLDSDDCVEADYIRALYETAEASGCDIVYAGFSEMDENGAESRICRRSVLQTGETMRGTTFLARRMDAGDWHNEVWCALYRRDFLLKEKLFFDENCRLYEDILFSNRAAVEAKSVCTVPTYGYLYRIREQSLVHSGIGKRDLDNCVSVVQKMSETYRTLHGEKQAIYGRALFEHISMTVYHIGMSENTDKNAYYAKLKQPQLLKTMRNCAVTRKEKLKYLIFRYAIRLYYPMVRKRD